jgi:acetylornithine/N-succinyldiaminopimelate aminotransferase
MVTACQEEGVLVLVAGPDVLRFLPPLNISTADLQTALDRVGKAMKKLHADELSSSTKT